MANDIEQRVQRLEDSEGIIYKFVGELRTYSKKLDREHEEMKDTLKEFMSRTDELLGQNKEMVHSMIILQGDTLRLIKGMDARLSNLEDRKNGA